MKTPSPNTARIILLAFLSFCLIISKAKSQFSAGLRTGISLTYYYDNGRTYSYPAETRSGRNDPQQSGNSPAIPARKEYKQGPVNHISITPGLEGFASWSGSNRMFYRIGLCVFSIENPEPMIEMIDPKGRSMGTSNYTRRYIGSSLMAGYRLVDAEKVKFTAALGVIPSLQYYGGWGIFVKNAPYPIQSNGLPETHRINSPYYRFLLAGILSAGAEFPLGNNWLFTVESVWSADLYKKEKQKYTEDSGPDAWKGIGNLAENWHFLSANLMPGIKYQF